MHFAIVCFAISMLFVSCKHQHHPALKPVSDIDYHYTQYDLELEKSSKLLHRHVRKVLSKNAAVTHRKVEIIVTERTTSAPTTEDRKLRYNEKVYLPVYHAQKNSTHHSNELLTENLPVKSMLPRAYNKKQWHDICFPLTGAPHPDGALDYFDAIQAMRPPNYFPSMDNEPPFIKFFAETRYPVADYSKLKRAMARFLRCLFSVISHVPEEVKRKKMTKMLFASIIGWLKDSLLAELFVLEDRPEKSIVEMEIIVQTLVHMRNKRYLPDVAPEALKTYEFVSPGEEAALLSKDERRGFRVTTAIMITTGLSLLFLLVTLGACVAAAVSRPALRQIHQLPEAYLPLDVRPSQLMDRTGRSASLATGEPNRVATPAGYEQQIRKMSVIPESSVVAEARRTSLKADQEQQLSPLLDSNGDPSDTTGIDGSSVD